MDHNTCRENLSAYLDGELPQQEKALLEAHLAGCPDCRAVLGQLCTVSGIMKKHIMEPVPLSLKKQVLSGPAKAARPWLRPVLALTTAAVGLLVVMNLSRTSEEGLAPASFGARGGGEASFLMSMPSGEAGQAMPEEAATPAAPATAAGLFAESDKKAELRTGVSSVRGAYGQAKFASARSSGGLSAGAAGSGGAGVSAMSGLRPAARQVPYTVDALASLQVQDGTRLRVTGTVGDCVDRMVSESGEAGPPGGCHLNGTKNTIVLDNFDANPYRGTEITVEGSAKYCQEGTRRFLCALENVSLPGQTPRQK